MIEPNELEKALRQGARRHAAIEQVAFVIAALIFGCAMVAMIGLTFAFMRWIL